MNILQTAGKIMKCEAALRKETNRHLRLNLLKTINRLEDRMREMQIHGN